MTGQLAGSLLVQWHAGTDVGLVREHNEDSYVAVPGLFVVADGMGGHQGGEVASRLAVETLSELTQQPGIGPDDIQAAVQRAHQVVADAGAADPGLYGMGTTLTGLALVDVDGALGWAAFNVGDSRVYHLSDGVLQQVSVDHSEVQELVDEGRLQPEQARTHPRSNVITRFLGDDETPQVDLWLLSPRAGQQFLICSDGLTGEVRDDVIADILRSAPSPLEAVDALIEAALAAGGHDNVTVIVVRAASDGSAPAAADGSAAAASDGAAPIASGGTRPVVPGA
jgi:PPM family protein phosphatase